MYMLSLKYSYSRPPSYISRLCITSVLSNADNLHELPNHSVRILWSHQVHLELGVYLMYATTNINKIRLLKMNAFQTFPWG